jgi:hypothetical protein
MGSLDWDDRKANKWQKLRESFNIAKKEKNLQSIIKIGESIIELDAEAKFLKILVPLFEKDIAGAYLKLDQKLEAIAHYQAALAGYKADQSKNPNSWVKDIDRLEKKIDKLVSGT